MTINVNVGRTAAATAKRRQLKAERVAADLVRRLPELDDQWVSALVAALAGEACERRLFEVELFTD